jgi:cobalt-zinc-cadmium efflux system protein
MVHDHHHGHGHRHAHGHQCGPDRGHGGDHEGHHDGHDHGHRHGHVHAPKDFGRAFLIGITLNVAFVVIEAGYGLWTGSMALLADAGHNLSDVFGLLIAWGASLAAKRPATARFTYGFGSSTILAALANAMLLLVAVGIIAWEATHRIMSPAPLPAITIMLVAAVGVAVNGFTAWLFMAGSRDDINVRGAYLHMAADALISVGVIVTGLLMLLTGWTVLDPLASLMISGVIVWGTWGLLMQALKHSLKACPDGIDPAAVRQTLLALPGVTGLHDLHIWPLSTTETALTCHLVIPSGHPGDSFIADAAAELKARYRISHTTLQIERGDARCELETCCAAPAGALR